MTSKVVRFNDTTINVDRVQSIQYIPGSVENRGKISIQLDNGNVVEMRAWDGDYERLEKLMFPNVMSYTEKEKK